MAESTTVEEPMERLADFDSDENAARENEISPAENVAVTAKCTYCGASMVQGEMARFNRGFGIVILTLGLLLSIFMLLLLGLPMVVIGAYMGVASRSVWTCPACRAVVDRNGV